MGGGRDGLEIRLVSSPPTSLSSCQMSPLPVCNVAFCILVCLGNTYHIRSSLKGVRGVGLNYYRKVEYTCTYVYCVIDSKA